MSYYLFNKKELLQKAENKYHNCEGNEKAAEYYLKNKYVKIINLNICQENKKKQKGNVEKIDIKT